MRTLFIAVLLVVVSGLALAQSNANAKVDDVFIPRTLSAGTSMSARTVAASLDDTTQAVRVAGFSAVVLTLQTATNDSVGLKVSYQPSFDGVTFAATFVLIDSLTSTGTVGYQKGFPLPAAALGFNAVRFRVEGTNAGQSGQPSATVTTRIRRKPY